MPGGPQGPDRLPLQRGQAQEWTKVLLFCCVTGCIAEPPFLSGSGAATTRIGRLPLLSVKVDISKFTKFLDT